MSTPRDHHFHPVFYLQQWVGPTGKLIEYTIKHGKLIAKPVGPRATGFETDLYAFPELPPDVRQYVEQEFFNYADRVAALALEKHLRGEVIWDPELLNAWSRFIIDLHLRHPDAMPELRAAAQAIWTASGSASQNAYEAIRKPGDPATFDEYLELRDPLIAAKMRMNMIIKSFDNEILRARINGMIWEVVDVSASPLPLLISDRPVELARLNGPRGIVSIPISPTKLFVAVDNAAVLNHLRAKQPEEIVEHVNEYVVGRARRFVWARDESQIAFVGGHMSKSMEPTPLMPGIGEYLAGRTIQSDVAPA
jgi:Protein of unknown function (DUF4238)